MSLKPMKLNVFYGDTKNGNVVDCDSFEDAEKLIRESEGKGFANIVLKQICIITTTSISRRGFRAANTISPLNF